MIITQARAARVVSAYEMGDSPSPADIRAARDRAGLTQQQAAELAGVDRGTWARYEIGMRPIPLPTWRYWLHIVGLERIPFRAR